ncbi:methyltransferase domain-containing protein [uncultured Desulfuromusa sp.]|uniref:class I SAM-dependent methyltransferase n=1 Tax=uncultured Desulfuromusa sp. TaxID=219183 RepID=UPI002AA69B91|nr:methyltransferase domain-containing protein [uncultured Desulfuromusa sp.]
MTGKKFDPKKLRKLNDPQRLLDIPPDHVCGKLSQQNPDVLIEIGTGTAFFSLAFHQQLKASITYACDLSDTMIHWIEENITPNYPYITPVKSEESSVPLSDGIADLVFMINLHHELEDQSLVMQEALRLLKPEGEVFIIDWKKEDMPQGPPVEIRCFPEQVELQLEKAGFVDIRSFDEMPKHFLVIGKKQ